MLQQVDEQVDARNINGVATQWIVHSVLAEAPIKSEFTFKLICIYLQFLTIHGYAPQHFLNLRPLPHGQGLFLPTLGDVLVYGFVGPQQLESLQQLWFSIISRL